LRASAAEAGERGMKTFWGDMGGSDDFELGASRWRLEGGRKGVAVNLKVRLLHRRGLPSLSVGVRDAGAEVLSKPEKYAVFGVRFQGRGEACLGLMSGPGGMEVVGGASYRLSLSTTLLLDFRGGKANLGAQFEVPFLGLFAKWAVLDVGEGKDLAVLLGWRL